MGITAAAAAIVGLGGLWVLVESLFYLTPGLKVAAAAAVCLVTLAVWTVLSGIPLIRHRGLERSVMIVERRFPVLSGRLIGALQLWGLREGSPEGYSGELIDAAIRQAEEVSRNLDLPSAVDHRQLMLAVRIFGVMVAVVLLGFFLDLESASPAFLRCLHPMTVYSRPPESLLTVTPGNVRIFKERDVTVGVTIRGKIPRSLTLFRATMGDDLWEPILLAMGGRDSVGYIFREVRAPFRYRVKAGRTESGIFTVDLIDRPVIQKVTAIYRPPPYTGIVSTTEEGGDLKGVIGTQVSLEAWTNRPLRMATIVMDDSSEVPCRVMGRAIEADLKIVRNTNYHFALVDIDRMTDPEPTVYYVEAIPDERPSVEIVEPGEDTEMPDNMTLPLGIEAGDDFGISRLRLLYRLNDAVETRVESLTLPPGTRTSVEVDYLWNLTSLSLLPGDRLTYFSEVHDNDGVSGPKRTRSQEFIVRFPTMEEIFKTAERQQASGVVDMEGMIEEGKRIKGELERLSRDLMKEKQLGWAQKKEVQAAIEKQQRMAGEMKSIASKIGETVDRLEQSGRVSVETLQKLEEIKKLMQEVATPELLRSMERLKKAMESLSPEEIRRAMKDFALNQEEFQKRLDRTLSLLKRMQVEQRIERAVKKAEELLARQERINQGTEKAVTAEEQERMASEEEGVKKDLEGLGNELESIQEQMKNSLDLSGTEVGKVGERIKKGETLRRMEKMTGQLRAGQMKMARAGGAQNASDLQQFLSELRQAQSSMVAGQKAQISREVSEAINNLLYLSKRQERAPVDAEEQQSLILGVSKVANGLFETAQKTLFISPEVGQAVGRSIKEMEKALKQLEEGDSSPTREHQLDAMASLNETVILLRRAMEGMASAQSAIGFSEMVERMQGLSGRQELINQGTEALRHGGGLSMEERALMARLAAEQEAVRKSVEDLARDVQGGGGIKARLEDLEREMREVLRDLSRQQIDPKTRERQERILSRMLDAMRSIHERDGEKRRKAEVGRDRPYWGPLSLPEGLGEKKDLVRERMDEAMKAGYGKRDQAVIRRYFENLLKKQEEHE